ncbi:MAG: RagB/SusD family nutrient uptake outer membrane protein [Muribaculaceae bacterium]|nr:RagB/SusD family nutrient uptake outer membrane protein [Muribaculaceae bacterium]
MNKFKYSILTAGIAAMGLMTGACADSFLDVSSKTESNTENFYKTEGDAWRALLGCYDGWRQISSSPGVGFYVASTVMSDECYGATGYGDGYGYQAIDGFDQSKSPSDQNLYEQDWKMYYAGVYRCNERGAQEEQSEWKSEANHGLYMAECRAIRALLYFDMVRLWGNIPLFLEPVSENREQADPAEVYAAIVSDLKYAAENIPQGANRSTADNGRITRYAAESMLARVYLFYTGYYGKELEGLTKAEVVNYLDDVVANGGYSLVEGFKNLWPAASLVQVPLKTEWDPALSTYAGSVNSEFILQQKFTPTQDYNGNQDSNRWQVMMGMRSLNWTPYGKGWGAATVTPAYNNKFAASDPRKTASIINLAVEGVTGSKDYSASVKDWREFTGFCVKKYSPLGFLTLNDKGEETYLNASRPDGSGDFQITNSQDWVIMRYADVLLMVAELGGVPSKTAQAALDDVRARAGLPSVPATLDNVMNERALELAFEGHRYWDLLRQGIDKAADAIAATAGPVKNGGIEASVTYDRSKIIATKGLSQIPVNQIILSNGVLHQNAGWE